MRLRTVVGLTGGIGSGKSTAASTLAQMGACVIDADRIAHEVTASRGSAIPTLLKAFGTACLTPDGALNRVYMRDLVFKNPAARQQLQDITHPLIQTAINNDVAHATQSVVVLDIPLLVESRHWSARCDWVVVVDCSETTQIKRIVHRNGWSHAQAQAVIKSQASRAARLTAADVTLVNDTTSLVELSASVTQLGHWLGL